LINNLKAQCKIRFSVGKTNPTWTDALSFTIRKNKTKKTKQIIANNIY